MMGDLPSDTEMLLQRAANGESAATDQLFSRYRDRLRRMVAVRLDSRLKARLDPSDVVQEAMAEASRKLPTYVQQRPLPFYPWLRRLAWEQLVQSHRQHLYAQSRCVARETQGNVPLPDESVAELVHRLAASDTSPINRLMRREMFDRVRTALEHAASADREVLVLRHLEQLSGRGDSGNPGHHAGCGQGSTLPRNSATASTAE